MRPATATCPAKNDDLEIFLLATEDLIENLNLVAPVMYVVSELNMYFLFLFLAR